MNKRKAKQMKDQIAQDMPDVQVEILTKNHHNASEACTLRVVHTTKERILTFNDPDAWESIYCVWSVL